MDLCDQIRPMLRRLVGAEPIPTISRGRPNWILGVDHDQILVHTEKTRREGEPQPVPVEWIEDVCRMLCERGRVSRDDLQGTKARFRSAFIFAILAQLPGVRHVTEPKATLYLI